MDNNEGAQRVIPPKDAKIRTILKGLTASLEEAGISSDLFQSKSEKEDQFKNQLVTYNPEYQSIPGTPEVDDQTPSNSNPIFVLKIPAKKEPGQQHELIIDATIGVLFGLRLAPSNYVWRFKSASLYCYLDPETLTKKGPSINFNAVRVVFESDVEISFANHIENNRPELRALLEALEDLQKQSLGKQINSSQIKGIALDMGKLRATRLNCNYLEASLTDGCVINILLNAFEPGKQGMLVLTGAKLRFQTTKLDILQSKIDAKITIQTIESSSPYANLVSNLDFLFNRLT